MTMDLLVGMGFGIVMGAAAMILCGIFRCEDCIKHHLWRDD